MSQKRVFSALAATIVLVLGCATSGSGGLFEDILGTVGNLKSPAGGGLEEGQVVSGLKEALSVGTANAVAATSAVDGYFANAAIRILLPEKLQKAAALMKKVGFRQEVDDFVLSMNRAAEKAAPQAKARFVAAIREMTFDDARRILEGGDTAATDYFEGKTRRKLYDDFRPAVAKSMDEVGVTRSYKRMMAKYAALPLAPRAESLDLDRHVTEKALDGLFHMVGQEERKIRTDPAARVTEILKTVFGGKR
jgi:hypothetical protein